MSEFTHVPLQDKFETQLSQQIDAGATSCTLITAPSFTSIPAGQDVLIGIDYDNTLYEIRKVTAVSGSTLTLNATPLATYYGQSPTSVAHSAGAKVIISHTWQTFEDIRSAIASKLNTGGGTLTGPVKGPVYANAAARDVAIPSPENGQSAYLTAEGKWTDYVAGSWADRASGTNPNASETVAGKVEQATLAEQIAKTETGATGAPLFLNPKHISFSSSDAAQGKLAGLNASNYVDKTLIDPATTIYSTTIPLVAGETVDGSSLPIPIAISDGTGGRTSGRFYKADANDTANGAVRFDGFCNVNAASAGTTYNVIVDGIVGGFSGLTIDAPYYVSDTVGTISTTPGTVQLFVGYAISATQIRIGQQQSYALIDSNVTRTDTQTASAPKAGTFTVATSKRARLIKFSVSVFDNLQSGSNNTRVRTYNCYMDLINQRITAQLVYSANNQNQTTPTLFTSGAANLSDLMQAPVQTMSNAIITVDNSGATSNTRIDSIVSTENLITFSYTLNTGSVADDCGIALSTVLILG